MNSLPLWQQAAGVLAATVLVLAWALVARRVCQKSGRHRPDRVTQATDVFDRVLAVVPAEPESVDDWTADLPTAELLVVITGSDLAEHYQSVALAGARFAAEVRSGEVRHTSPSERARQRWGVECPIFASLADEYGYDLGGEFGELRHRPVAA